MGSGILRALHVIPGVTDIFCAKHCARDLRAHVVKGRPQGGSGRNSGNTASLEVGQKNWHARGRWLCRSENGQSWERTDSVNTFRPTTDGNFCNTQYAGRHPAPTHHSSGKMLFIFLVGLAGADLDLPFIGQNDSSLVLKSGSGGTIYANDVDLVRVDTS